MKKLPRHRYTIAIQDCYMLYRVTPDIVLDWFGFKSWDTAIADAKDMGFSIIEMED